jgi:hypothetical protein
MCFCGMYSTPPVVCHVANFKPSIAISGNRQWFKSLAQANELHNPLVFYALYYVVIGLEPLRNSIPLRNYIFPPWPAQPWKCSYTVTQAPWHRRIANHSRLDYDSVTVARDVLKVMQSIRVTVGSRNNVYRS